MSEQVGIPDKLDTYVVPVESADPEQDHGDLQPLRSVFDDRRVIGLGEATHGTREFFHLKHRFIRFLVEECDLRVVGLEANFSEALAINEYVLHGEGDPRNALADIYFWTWDTEEVLSLLEWLRAFNAGRPPSDRVRFYGFDAQYTAGPVAALHSFVERADPDYHETIRSQLETVDDDADRIAPNDDIERWFTAADQVVEELRTRLSEHEAEYVAATDRETYELACRHLRTIAQAIDLKRARHDDDHVRSTAIRDRAMADNVVWLLEYEHADRIALWAHNGHLTRVQMSVRGDAVSSMGTHLADRYGDDYYALGFEFGGGAFQAVTSIEASERNDPERHVLETAISGTVGRAIAARDYPPLFVLDFESARANRRIETWLDSTQRIQSIGAVYPWGDDPENHSESYVLGDAFDGLCYVDDTTRARPIDRD